MIEPGKIVNCPGIGECFVIRSKEFETGVKWELKDMYGRTWHKRADELHAVKGANSKPKRGRRSARLKQGDLFQ